MKLWCNSDINRHCVPQHVFYFLTETHPLIKGLPVKVKHFLFVQHEESYFTATLKASFLHHISVTAVRMRLIFTPSHAAHGCRSVCAKQGRDSCKRGSSDCGPCRPPLQENEEGRCVRYDMWGKKDKRALTRLCTYYAHKLLSSCEDITAQTSTWFKDLTKTEVMWCC